MSENLARLARWRPLVLGSGSPRRRRILTQAGIKFRVNAPEVDETFRLGENPYEFAQRLAEEKAVAVAKHCNNREIVLGGDTVVVLQNKILDKPSTEQEAVDTLVTLAGHVHTVCTALALAESRGLICSGIEKTLVRFNEVTKEQIREYVASGEPMDKAGAYGIQGMGAFLVDTIEGELDNVIGLPLTLLDNLAGQTLRKLGTDTDRR
jgi:septum formation protein